MDVELLFPSTFLQKRKYEGFSERPSKSFKFRDGQSAVDFTSCNLPQDHSQGSIDVQNHNNSFDDLGAFEALPLKSQLDILTAILDSTENYLERAIPLFSSFTRIHLSLKSEMKDSAECSHLALISEVISHLELFQRQPDLDNQKQEFQILGFTLLGLLARNESASEMMNQLDAIPLTTTQIKLSVANVHLFRSCCFALANLTNSIPKALFEAFQNYLIEEQLIGLLCSYLRDNSSNPRIISDVCVLLGNVIFFYNSNALEQEFGSEQIAFILELLSLHINEQELVGHLVFLLRNLCGHWRTTIEQNRGTETVLFVLNQYIWEPELCLDLVDIVFDLQKTTCAKPLSIETMKMLFRAIRNTFETSTLKQKLLLQSLFSYFITKCETKKIEMIEAGLVEILHNMKLPNAFHLNHFFEAIARLPETVYSSPTETVPTLQELTLRSIKNKLDQEKQDQNIFAFLVDDGLQGDYETKKNSFLCDEMKECLDTKSQGNCHVCQTCVFDHYFKFLKKERLDGTLLFLPVARLACSKRCLTKLSPFAVTQTQIGI